MRPRFWELPLGKLDREEWEALCDGCGKCCLLKVEDEDNGDVYQTNLACKLLDIGSGRCCDYRNRRAAVPDCVQLTPDKAASLPWLPETCAYRLRAEGDLLPDWHYLICGDREAVHAAGASVRGKAISEQFAGPIEQHIIWPEGMEPMGLELLDEDDDENDQGQADG